MAAPTPDHFIPLLYLAGLASAAGDTAHVLVDGYAMGSLSMTSYTLGCHELEPDGRGGSPTLPDDPRRRDQHLIPPRYASTLSTAGSGFSPRNSTQALDTRVVHSGLSS